MRLRGRKAVDAWLEATTPRPAVDHADVAAQIERLRAAARDRARLEVRRDWVGDPAGVQAAVDAIASARSNRGHETVSHRDCMENTKKRES